MKLPLNQFLQPRSIQEVNISPSSPIVPSGQAVNPVLPKPTSTEVARSIDDTHITLPNKKPIDSSTEGGQDGWTRASNDPRDLRVIGQDGQIFPTHEDWLATQMDSHKGQDGAPAIQAELSGGFPILSTTLDQQRVAGQ